MDMEKDNIMEEPIQDMAAILNGLQPCCQH